MHDDERRALTALRFQWAETDKEVWGGNHIPHVEQVNAHILNEVAAAIEETHSGSMTSPIGVAVVGEKGAGKTHIIGWARRHVQEMGGYFVLATINFGRSFWDSMARALVQGLQTRNGQDQTQLAVLLDRLAELAGVEPRVRKAIVVDRVPSVSDIDALARGLRQIDDSISIITRNVVRALALLHSRDESAESIATTYLNAVDVPYSDEHRSWCIQQDGALPQDIVRSVSYVMALTGPTLIATDQIDGIIANSFRSTNAHTGASNESSHAEHVGSGLMDLRECVSRTVTLVACLPASWEAIKRTAVNSASDRFRGPLRCRNIPNTEVAKAFFAAHFEPFYKTARFTPPYPHWPIARQALKEAVDMKPRDLLKAAYDHAKKCVDADETQVLATFTDTVEHVTPVVTEAAEFDQIDEYFQRYWGSAEVRHETRQDITDHVMPELLKAGLSAWCREQPEDVADSYHVVEQPVQSRPARHAVLHREVGPSTHKWCFLVMTATHGNAIGSRVDRMRDANDPGDPHLYTYVLRTSQKELPTAAAKHMAEFTNNGGSVLGLDESDLRVFDALKRLLAEKPPGLEAWLRARRPASNTVLFKDVFGAPIAFGTPPENATKVPAANDDIMEVTNPASHDITIGDIDGKPAVIPLESLRRHIAIFAGSGSGKTVLIRRIIEECALRGVSAIVLDPNNDLARLGDKWPTAPTSWNATDQQRSTDYLDNTDVVVWTPRIRAGRPLEFRQLPDFAPILNDPDAFSLAAAAALSALAPRAKITGNTPKAEKSRAILREAIEHFARRGGQHLEELIALLRDLPDDLCGFAKAHTLAEEIGDTLEASKINDKSIGNPVELDELLDPPAGKRARVSVINFIGLDDDERRQNFVSQLQLQLFSWIRKNPVQDRPLGWLFVMDEAQTFAPSTGATACLEPTRILASQGRKFGLGMIFATQAPKAVDNRVTGNATTQLYGYLRTQVQIAAVQQIANNKKSKTLDIAGLGTGQFYLLSETHDFNLMSTRMCLSHHPSSALEHDGIVTRARKLAS